MTTTKILENVLNIKTALYNGTGCELKLLDELIKELKGDITMQEAKRSGKHNRLKAALKFLKDNEKTHPQKEALHYVKTIDGVQYIMGNSSIFKFTNTDILDLPELPDDIEALQYEKFFPDASGEDITELIPSIPELKSIIKIAKAEKNNTPTIDIKSDKYLLDAKLLLQSLEIMPEIDRILLNDYKVHFIKDDEIVGLLLCKRKRK